MKQIYFTFCQNGLSMTGRGGDHARAASAGISGGEAESYKSICAWSAPEGLLDLSPEERLQFTPKALKYTEVAGQKILVHSVYALPDAETKRAGNYFAHVLLYFPKGWNVKKALEFWESPIWKTRDSRAIQTPLPDIEVSACPPTKINDKTFLRFIQDPWHADIFSFLFQNWLLRQSEESIVLCCKPEEAVFCLWGLTRYLPQSFWNSLTFSTYEKPRQMLTYDVTAFSTLRESFNETEQIVLSSLRQQWPQVRVFPDSSQRKENAFPFVDEWVQLILAGEGDTILEFFRKVPEKYQHEFQTLNVFWNILYHNRSGKQDIEIALKLPEIHSQAEKAILAMSATNLEWAFQYLRQLNPAAQEELLDRLLKEKTLAEIKANPDFCRSLVAVLCGKSLPSFQPPKPGQQVPVWGRQSRRAAQSARGPYVQPAYDLYSMQEDEYPEPQKNWSSAGCFPLILFFILVILAGGSALFFSFLKLF